MEFRSEHADIVHVVLDILVRNCRRDTRNNRLVTSPSNYTSILLFWKQKEGKVLSLFPLDPPLIFLRKVNKRRFCLMVASNFSRQQVWRGEENSNSQSNQHTHTRTHMHTFIHMHHSQMVSCAGHHDDSKCNLVYGWNLDKWRETRAAR